MKAYLVTVVVKHCERFYEEYFTLKSTDRGEAEALAWDFLRGGYYWDVDPEEVITADEGSRSIEEPYGNRFYSIDSVNEIPAEYAHVLQACRVAWDETERARSMSANLKEASCK